MILTQLFLKVAQDLYIFRERGICTSVATKKSLLEGGLKLNFPKKIHGLTTQNDIHILRCVLTKNHIFWNSFDHVYHIMQSDHEFIEKLEF